MLVRVLALAFCASALAASIALADDEDDRVREQDRVRALVERGEALPLAEILAIVGERVPGEVIDLELDFDDGELVYEVEVLTRTGRVLEVEIDAATGEILEIEED